MARFLPLENVKSKKLGNIKNADYADYIACTFTCTDAPIYKGNYVYMPVNVYVTSLVITSLFGATCSRLAQCYSKSLKSLNPEQY